MSIPGSVNPLLLAALAGAAADPNPRSLRFNSADSAFLSRTPAVAGNRTKWTWAGWLKRSELGRAQFLFCGGPDTANDTDQIQIFFQSNDTLRINSQNSSFRETTQVFRDVSAWYHFVIAVDTTIASPANDRIKFYVNGSQVTTFNITVNPTQNANTGINATTQHTFGRSSGVQYTSSAFSFSGYLAETYLIDGQALTPSSFGETNATTGVWDPIAYAGTYGTNGFKLDFRNYSSAAALGTDTSPNGNTWTVNNLSVTAGAGNDSLVDSPTSYGTDTYVGGEVRGNYCTMNPLLTTGSACTFSNGNLETAVSSIGSQRAWGTFGVSSGKWYFEYIQTSGSYAQGVGIKSTFNSDNNNNYAYTGYDGTKVNASGSATSYGATWGINDVIGVAFDLDNATITFYKNGTSQGTAFTGIDSGTYFPYFSGWSGGSGVNFTMNFGQRAFAYTAPSGFKALCTQNLPAPVVAKPNTVMDVKLYTGNGSTQTISGLGFSPDWVWLKPRNEVSSNVLFDIVRSTNLALYSNATTAETTEATSLTAFNSDGFNLGANNNVNKNAITYVAWTWDAGSSTVSNTQGSITSQVRANASAGFSIVTWTSPAAAHTIGHGLGAAPRLIIAKVRNTTSYWWIYHQSLGATYSLNFDTAAANNTYNAWNGTSPTSNVFSMGFTSAYDWVAYCFAPVVGYSSFGSYTGNYSADGPFVYTGMRPRWIMIKCSSTNNGYTFWDINDAARSDYNSLSRTLCADLSDAEDSANIGIPNIDILSNGFKIRTSGSAKNLSGQTYIYAAFAESPFAYARAR